MTADNPFSALRTPPPAPNDARWPVAVVTIVAFDRFKDLRRRIGYDAATRLLDALSRRASAELPCANVGRIGRTSFELFFRVAEIDHAVALLERVRTTLASPLEVEGIPLTLSPTIGAAEIDEGGISDQALDAASLALEEAEGTHQPVRLVRRCEQADVGQAELALLKDIRAAMASGDLTLLYQPKLRLRTNSIDSAEALLRWNHPRRGAIRVDALIRLAEETGAIRAITEWALSRAVSDQQALLAQGHALTLWVNISGQLLPDSEFAAAALNIVRDAGGRIGFEITETAVIGDPHRTLANLAAFAAAGIKIAIDDYGSGLSSLSYLKQLPAQELKIDRLFIKDLIDSHRDPLLVRSSIDLAHALEMEVTAEGVENPVTLALLRVMGCDMVQGFLIAAALTLDELASLVADPDRLMAFSATQIPMTWPGKAA